jgi:hypothetical protein
VNRPPRAVVALLVLLAFVAAGCGRTGPEAEVAACAAGAPKDRILPACVWTPRGAMDVEDTYLPGVVQCEVGGFRDRPAVLEAQAIAARTYLLAHLLRKGPLAEVPLTSRFQCWKAEASGASVAAVRATTDRVMHTFGEVLDANYAAGIRHREKDCAPAPPARAGYDQASWAEMRSVWQRARKEGRRRPFDGVSWTELLVTDNGARDGLAVVPTPFAPARATNRGAFGQWAAACLARARGYDHEALLRHFYGRDLELSPLPGAPETQRFAQALSEE